MSHYLNHQTKINQLERVLNYQFKTQSLLIQALSHRSYTKDNNERMEFLGDSVLGFLIAEYLYQHFKNASEGQMSRLRSNLVRKETLAQLARNIQLGDYLLLGAGELQTGGHTRTSTLEDAMEAIIAAIYLDSDINTTRDIILALMGKELKNVSLDKAKKDNKSQLQEYLQKNKINLPIYTITKESGPQHDQIFEVSCYIETLNIICIGKGKGRRKAEQDAALNVLKTLHI